MTYVRRRPQVIPVCIAALAMMLVDNVAVRGAAPVLVLTDGAASNPFGNYLTEILRGEGLLAFEQRDRAALNGGALASSLANYQTIVMAEMSLTSAEEGLLRNYVASGGVLIGARPDDGLSDVFGIELAGNRPERTLQYFGVDLAQQPGRRITAGPLQYHGVASNYNLQGATGLAYLYANADTPTANPAVTTHQFGQGRAVAFSFDPAKSVVLTRQGNPEWQNSEGDGIPEYRPHDMFTRTDGRTYYDVERMAIPHADELQRLAANVMIDANPAPLPRMWYLPAMHKTLMVNTGDGEDNYDSQFNDVLDAAASYGGTFSVYLRDVGVQFTPPAQEAAWRAAGHEVGVHMYADGLDGAGAESYMTFAYDRVVSALEQKFGHGARTARSHTIDWTGWVDMARIEANRGTQLDTNYYHYLNAATVDPLSANGYFTGSGLAQRFIDENGELLDVYQAATQWPDEWFGNTGMTAAQAVEIMTTMFETAEREGYYSTFVNNIHPVRYNGADITSAWSHAIWQYCQERSIPMWSAEKLLDFTLARNGSQFENIVYAPGSLAFDYVAGAGGFDLTLMIPFNWSDDLLQQITVDGAAIDWAVQEIKGVEYAMFTTPLAEARIAVAYGPAQSADFNRDGRVDADDLAQWRESFGLNASGDANGDGVTDGVDFLTWQRQFNGAAASAANVPEPTALTLLAICGPCTFAAARRLRVPSSPNVRPSRESFEYSTAILENFRCNAGTC